MLVNAIERTKTTHKVTVDHPFVYQIKGDIETYDEKVHLCVKSVSYILEWHKPHRATFDSYKMMNELEVIFN